MVYTDKIFETGKAKDKGNVHRYIYIFKKNECSQPGALVKLSFQKQRRPVVRPRVVHWLLTCHHPVAVDAAAACVDVHVEQLLLMLMSTAADAGPTGIATAGIARLLLTQTAGCSYSTVSAVVGGWGGDKLEVGVVLPRPLLIHNWRMVTHQSRMIFFLHHCPGSRHHHLPRGKEIGLKLR
jgi:hypothetical protein